VIFHFLACEQFGKQLLAQSPVFFEFWWASDNLLDEIGLGINRFTSLLIYEGPLGKLVLLVVVLFLL
jgi:hypothetical protein